MRKFICSVLACLLCCVCGVGSIGNFSAKADEGSGLSNYADVLEAPKDRLVHAPVLVREIASEEEFSAFQKENKATSVIFTFQGGNIILGEKAIPAQEVLQNNSVCGKVIPVLQVENEEDATALIAFLQAQKLEDCFVMSAKAELVKLVRTACPMISGILDVRGEALDEIALRDKLNENMAKIALVDERFSAKQVRRLQALLMQVWVDSPNSALAELAKGVDGIVGKDVENYALIESLPEFSLMRKPIIVAHRGWTGAEDEDGKTYNENTVRSARAAVSGSSVEAIEIDVYLTRDGEVVVMHDPTLERTTNGRGNVESMTLQEIQQYQVVSENSSPDPIPTMEDFFKEFKRDNVYFFIEIKSSNPSILPKIKILIDSYSMGDRVSFISFNRSILMECRKFFPKYSVGVLVNSVEGYRDDNYQHAIGEIKSQVGYLNATLHVSYTGLNDYSLNEEVWARGIGIHTWTYRNMKYLRDDVAVGFHSLTTDYPNVLGDVVKDIQPKTTKIVYEEGEKLSFPVTLTTRSGYVEEVDARVMVVDGQLSLQETADGYEVLQEGTARVLYYLPDIDTGCYFYSDVVELTVQKKEETASGGCFGGVGMASGSGLAVLLAFAIKRKNTSKVKKS